jgi:hypothetical protein
VSDDRVSLLHIRMIHGGLQNLRRTQNPMSPELDVNVSANSRGKPVNRKKKCGCREGRSRVIQDD